MRKNLLIIVFCALMATAFTLGVKAQSSNNITIKLSRDFGYSSIGTNEIQGLFSITSSASMELNSVIYYIDNDVLGEVLSKPYKFQFTTDDFLEGQHIIFGEGKSEAGEVLRSQQITVTFISAAASRESMLKLIIPILGFTLLVSILAVLR